jgi:hypothetical protein
MGLIDETVESGMRLLVQLPGLRRDRLRKTLLRRALENPKYRWFGVDTLAKAGGLGEDLQKTRDLLISIHARPSTKQSEREMWGLVGRVGESSRSL